MQNYSTTEIEMMPLFCTIHLVLLHARPSHKQIKYVATVMLVPRKNCALRWTT